ncbi:MAG: 5'/3'-nucleotidase SurE [Bacteroidales bacterium]|nr:5'/3'-nucleotidase SurE [Bacteroidales bacterium]
MRILLTNDDGYRAKGLAELVEILKPFGELTVVAPKYHQSGMSMAVTMGLKPIAAKRLPDRDGVRWWYVDATPSSCVKYGLDEVFTDALPDVIVCGINHGSNAASASMYSATVGAAREGALAGVLSIALSVDDFSPDADFSDVKRRIPEIFRTLTQNPPADKSTFYNINFPKGEARGIRIGYQGMVHWLKEFRPYDYGVFDRLGITPLDMGILRMPEVEAGETVYVMAGDLTDDPRNHGHADHRQLEAGFITICPLKLDATDYDDKRRLESLF